MKKKALSLLVSIALLAGVCPVSVRAEFEITTSESQNFEVTEDGAQPIELSKPKADTAINEKYADYEWYAIEVENEGLVRDEIVLKMDGAWYFSTDQIEYYTDYRFDEEDMCFREDAVIKSGGLSKAIAIDTKDNTAFVRAYLQKLDNIYEYNDQLYYPVHQLLPLMECTISAEGNVLYLEHAQVSMVDALGAYVPEVYYFDANEEFAGKAWANLIMVGSAYLFDTVGHPKNWLRIGGAEYGDYKNAVEDYLTKYDVYQEVMEFTNGTTETAKQGKSYVKTAKKGENVLKFIEMIYDMLEKAGDVSDFYEFIPEDIWKEISSWAKGAEVAMDAVEAVSNYALMVQDHRDMLAVVYPKITKNVKWDDLKLRGIKSIYDQYGGDVIHSILYETAEELSKKGIWKAADFVSKGSIGLYKTVAEVGGNLMTKYVEQLGIKASDDMALLNHHITLTEDAKSKYHDHMQTGPYKQKKIEQIRLSALMTMLSSKKCFEIIRDNNAHYDEVVSYCNNQISQIDEFLKKFYLAKDAVMVDGIEYYQDGPEMFQTELKNLTGEESTPPAPPSSLEYFFRENYSKKDQMWLLDVAKNDGIEELLVVTAPDNEKITYFRIYDISSGEITMVFEQWAGAVPGERKAMYLMDDGFGNYAFLYYEPQTLQGKEDIIEVYAAQRDGVFVPLNSQFVKGEANGKRVLKEVVAQYYQSNPYWIELFNTLIGSEDEGMQAALDEAGVVMGLADYDELRNMSAEEKLEKYYATFYSEEDQKRLVDLIGDGQPELLAISEEEELIKCMVYAARECSVVQIWGDVAAEAHAGQKAMYLVDNMDGTYSLLLYTPSNWQGYRSISAEWFTIDAYGGWNTRDYFYTDSDQDMYAAVREFVWRIYPYSMNLKVLYDTIPESEKDEWTTAIDSFTQEEVLIGTPEEGSELNQIYNEDSESDWSVEEDWNDEWQEEYPEIDHDVDTGFVFQMPENIFWSIDDPFGSWQLRFRNENDGCYMDLRSPDGTTVSSLCELDMGTSIDIDIDDYKLLEMNVLSFSQDFTGGDYNITYSPETSQIFVTTANGQWIELYFFDD